MMPILACLISGLLTCGVLQLLDHQNTPALSSAGRHKATAAHQSQRPATLAANPAPLNVMQSAAKHLARDANPLVGRY